MAKMHNGLTKRIINKKMPKRLPFKVPQLVNSSFTSFLGTYQPRKRQVTKEPIGMRS